MVFDTKYYGLCTDELILTDLSEGATKLIAKEKNPKGLKENIKIARDGGDVAKTAREDLEKKVGKSVVSSDNRLNYQYIDQINKKISDKK